MSWALSAGAMDARPDFIQVFIHAFQRYESGYTGARGFSLLFLLKLNALELSTYLEVALQ